MQTGILFTDTGDMVRLSKREKVDNLVSTDTRPTEWICWVAFSAVHTGSIPGVLCYIGYPSETHLKLKSCEISFVHNIHLNCPMGLKFCTEHGSDTAVLCAKFQTDRWTEAWVMSKRDFVRFEFKMNFGRISHIAQGPWCHHEWIRLHLFNEDTYPSGVSTTNAILG